VGGHEGQLLGERGGGVSGNGWPPAWRGSPQRGGGEVCLTGVSSILLFQPPRGSSTHGSRRHTGGLWLQESAVRLCTSMLTPALTPLSLGTHPAPASLPLASAHGVALPGGCWFF
jgi:hypothetical protein